eukprot:4578428-Amphidinium_carterae.1
MIPERFPRSSWTENGCHFGDVHAKRLQCLFFHGHFQLGRALLHASRAFLDLEMGSAKEVPGIISPSRSSDLVTKS